MLSPADIAANPIGTDLIYEDDRIRVWRIDLVPGQFADFHTHELDYTTIVIDGDVVERPNGDGTTDSITVKPGQLMRWYEGTERHGLRNAGTRTFRNVIVEIKGVPADFAARAEGK
jgi:quercetin dioxygenase-like cupin family protein